MLDLFLRVVGPSKCTSGAVTNTPLNRNFPFSGHQASETTIRCTNAHAASPPSHFAGRVFKRSCDVVPHGVCRELEGRYRGDDRVWRCSGCVFGELCIRSQELIVNTTQRKLLALRSRFSRRESPLKQEVEPRVRLDRDRRNDRGQAP